jgi:hypothetical protein
MMPISDAETPQSTRASLAQPADELVANGPAAAAILSAGAGICALGVLAMVADGSKAVGRWFAFCVPSGSLSGVTTLTILVWLVLWFVLAKWWRVRNVNLVKVNALAFFLSACGLLLTFPPFADVLPGK